MKKYFSYLVGCVFPFIIIILLAYSYYSYVIEFCYFKLIEHDQRYTLSIVYLVVFHLIWILLVWCYIVLLLTKHHDIPIKNSLEFTSNQILKNVEPQKSVDNDIKCQINKNNDSYNSNNHPNNIPIEPIKKHIKEKGIKVITCNALGHINVCTTCMIVKPDRCHHCSVCNRCILRMDHHCPWLNRCIGFSNQKYFALLITYTFIYELFIFITTFSSLMESWSERFLNNRTEFHIFTLFIINISFILAIGLLEYHTLYLIILNRTNIDQSYPRYLIDDKSNTAYIDLFNSGSYIKNLQSIFGTNILLALIPVWTTPGNGYENDYYINGEIYKV